MARALACAAAALVLAGCGGGDGGGGQDGGASTGGGGSKAEATDRYAAQVDGFCADVTASVAGVQQDLTEAQERAGSDADKASAAVGAALTDFADAIDTALGDLRRAEVPADFRRFHDGAVGGLGRVVGALRDAGREAGEGDLTALRDLGTTLQGIRVPDPPAALRAKAPACQALSRAQQG